jgi:hypothetical protein
MSTGAEPHATSDIAAAAAQTFITLAVKQRTSRSRDIFTEKSLCTRVPSRSVEPAQSFNIVTREDAMIINLLSSSSARLRRCLSIAMGSLIGMALIAVAHPSTAHTLAQTPADIASPDIASPEISSPEISSADTPQLQAAALATIPPVSSRGPPRMERKELGSS